MSAVSALGLTADRAVVLRDSDKLTLRVLPCDLVARIAHVGREAAAFEVELAQRLTWARSPVAALDPRIEPRVHVRDGFAITLWTYYESDARAELEPAEYADALERLHAGMRAAAVAAPRFTDRVAGAASIVASRDRSPRLSDPDRSFLAQTLRGLSHAVEAWGAPEQLLHGEPHPGNVLMTKDGVVFVDLETCCRGPVEFDIAHAESVAGSDAEHRAVDVGEHYAGADPELVRRCVLLMLALITTWRWDKDDQLPDGRRLGVEWLAELRSRLGANRPGLGPGCDDPVAY